MSDFNRRGIRLKDCDYSRDGLYFLTICTYDWQQSFGRMIDGKMFVSTMAPAFYRLGA
ncbi:MAG: hypothetical protein LBJ12_06930 [Oscillospiraceae bacterium]|jgi:hypothetical protein|nr:hypothetical protein [Oscillospiraceae bacterium]